MKKRLWATIVCMMMMVSLISGCNSTPTALATASPTAAAVTTVPDETATAPAEKERKELTISWGAVMSDPNSDEYGKWMQNTFKIKLNIINADNPTKLQLLAATDSLPDFFRGGLAFGSALFNQLITQGLMRDIPDEILAKYPLLKKTIDEHALLSAYKVSTGKNYWLPVYSDADKPVTACGMPFYYRADWAKKLGIPTPTTVDEFYTMLKAFAQNDPDGNGKNDTYGLSGWLWQVHFITWVDPYAWVKEDGKWIPGYMSKKMLLALKFYNKLYLEKIMDPEFPNANDLDLFITDKIGCTPRHSSAVRVWNNIYRSFTGAHEGWTPEQSFEAVQFLPPLKADANSPAQWPLELNPWGYAFSAKASDDVVDRILDIANWELTPEGRDFMTYGFKDKDWVVKDGKAVSILPNMPTTGVQKKLWEVYPSQLSWKICEDFSNPGTPWLNPSLPQICIDRQNEWEAVAAPAVVKGNIIINWLSTPLRDKSTIDAQGNVEADFQSLVTKANIEEEYTAYIKQLLEVQGMQEVIDEMNATIAAKGLDK